MKTTWEIEAWIRKQYDAGSKDKTLQLYFGGAKFYCEIGDICAGSATLSGAIENAMLELRERDAKRPSERDEFVRCVQCKQYPSGATGSHRTGVMEFGCRSCNRLWKMTVAYGLRFKSCHDDTVQEWTVDGWKTVP